MLADTSNSFKKPQIGKKHWRCLLQKPQIGKNIGDGQWIGFSKEANNVQAFCEAINFMAREVGHQVSNRVNQTKTTPFN